MRLDLFLKTSRLIKRRVVAREMCDRGRVLVNGNEAKPAKEVTLHDIVVLKYSSRIIELEIIGLPAAASKRLAPEELYRVTADTRVEPPPAEAGGSPE